MEYWNSDLTEKSWLLLQELRKKYNFILIGGWASYLLTKQQKSKDIDIVIDIKELEKLKQENLIKNDRLKKYEIKFQDIDVDIYLPFYSKLTFPLQELKEYAIEIEGFKLASPEALLILKQGAEINRRNSIKGEKDKIDILSILFFSSINIGEYLKLIKKYSLDNYRSELVGILKNFRDYNVLHLTPKEFKIKKEKLSKELKKI